MFYEVGSEGYLVCYINMLTAIAPLIAPSILKNKIINALVRPPKRSTMEIAMAASPPLDIVSQPKIIAKPLKIVLIKTSRDNVIPIILKQD